VCTILFAFLIGMIFPVNNRRHLRILARGSNVEAIRHCDWGGPVSSGMRSIETGDTICPGNHRFRVPTSESIVCEMQAQNDSGEEIRTQSCKPDKPRLHLSRQCKPGQPKANQFHRSSNPLWTTTDPVTTKLAMTTLLSDLPADAKNVINCVTDELTSAIVQREYHSNRR
jgi:hypothetical protein